MEVGLNINSNVANKIRKGMNFKKNLSEELTSKIAPTTEHIAVNKSRGMIFLKSKVEKVFLKPTTEPR